eukprot:CAMPEP_0179191926 /NCGR_PEP_ID=MMETSP0796-20121207/95336_1 /TAXON_ID=73915 /ORGANISM="Pyrodinium bahamense, Strain pbaha01" /LENGTH=289 /DNA_ID=CAMNT_0020896161 /DNA_START=72 /DNA_END=937 /DNA_ORIENTATION=-
MPNDVRQESQHTALVIWLHGLGDTGKGWADLRTLHAASMPWTKWSFPTAPVQPVTCNSGALTTSWFDLSRIPVQGGEEHAGLESAAAKIQEFIRQAEQEGIPPSRIAVGGFSQGGALSLLAGLCGPHGLAGVCCLSGWACAGLQDAIAHPSTPVLICHGTADQVVPCEAGQQAAEVLRRAKCTDVRFNRYLQLPHTASPELEAVRKFLLEVLPEQLPSDPHSTLPQGTPTFQISVRQDVCRVEVYLAPLEGVVLDICATAIQLSGTCNLLVELPVPIDIDDAQASYSRA